MPIDDLLNRLEAAEQRFAGSLFLAPLTGARQVSVRIAGVVCRLRVTSSVPEGFHGIAMLRALSTSQAEFVRPASLSERAAYLAAVDLILLHQTSRQEWLALPAHKGDTRFHIQGAVPLLLAEEGLERFETAAARFDGSHFWYDRRSLTRDPALAAYLREQFAHLDPQDRLPPPPEALRRPGLSAEERQAYAFLREALRFAQRSQAEGRLESALEHAGAHLLSYTEREGAYVVNYELDGRRHTSLVRPNDLTILTAGICLSGQDQRFDLASLVGVLREGSDQRRLVWVEGEEE
jgi:hypothetical protein